MPNPRGPRPKKGVYPGFQRTFPGSEYTDEQRQFILTMGALKSRLGRQPTDAEVFAAAVKMGYRRHSQRE